MEVKKYKLSRETVLGVPLPELDAVLGAADGSLALLYLYALRSGEAFDPSEAATALKLTASELEASAARLQSLGLLEPPAGLESSRHRLPPSDNLPEYSADDLASLRVKGEFDAIVSETQRVFGRLLSTSELKILFGLFDYLALPAEVILVLVNHCVEEFRQMHGEGRLPSMRTIEKEAYYWANNEIITYERAEKHLRESKLRQDELTRIKSLLQIYGRELSATERKYITEWLDMGFEPEALCIAYDRTVVKTGGLKWSYMNSILKSWHEKGLHTAEAVTQGDSVPAAARPGKSNLAPAPGREDLNRMKKALERIKNG